MTTPLPPRHDNNQTNTKLADILRRFEACEKKLQDLSQALKSTKAVKNVELPDESLETEISGWMNDLTIEKNSIEVIRHIPPGTSVAYTNFSITWHKTFLTLLEERIEGQLHKYPQLNTSEDSSTCCANLCSCCDNAEENKKNEKNEKTSLLEKSSLSLWHAPTLPEMTRSGQDTNNEEKSLRPT